MALSRVANIWSFSRSINARLVSKRANSVGGALGTSWPCKRSLGCRFMKRVLETDGRLPSIRTPAPSRQHHHCISFWTCLGESGETDWRPAQPRCVDSGIPVCKPFLTVDLNFQPLVEAYFAAFPYIVLLLWYCAIIVLLTCSKCNTWSSI